MTDAIRACLLAVTIVFTTAAIGPSHAAVANLNGGTAISIVEKGLWPTDGQGANGKKGVLRLVGIDRIG